MTHFKEKLEDGLRELLRAAVNGTCTFADLQDSYGLLDREAQKHLSGETRVSARRAIAASLLTVAQVTGQPIFVCEPLFRSVLETGFQGLEDRLLQVGAYSRYCVRAGQPELTEKHLAEVLDEVRPLFEATTLAPYEDLLKQMQGS